ncbi:hypothetical protein [uncultured Methanobrevibacter sp.]|uniref:hypothetical protein n=1 Tax=uncultured Methanobrevibacter sp. TaxID=253161 RepID=UPI0025FCA54C|nr:hypothetical protein [uncultured Methanobrevibacter sp.]
MVKSFKQIVEATLVGKFNKKLTIGFTINKTFHAKERQSRHLEATDDKQSDHYISDEEIIATAEKASEKIIENIINNHIDIDDRFVIQDSYTNLNIVCVLHKGTSDDNLNVDIITVIYTNKFWNTKNSWIIKID